MLYCVLGGGSQRAGGVPNCGRLGRGAGAAEEHEVAEDPMLYYKLCYLILC